MCIQLYTYVYKLLSVFREVIVAAALITKPLMTIGIGVKISYTYNNFEPLLFSPAMSQSIRDINWQLVFSEHSPYQRQIS